MLGVGELTCASTGEEGLALAAGSSFDLFVVDVNLPKMSGFELRARLAENPRTASIPVIAVSAAAMESDRARAIDAGFRWYLTKPLKIDLFERTVLEALSTDERATT